MMSGPFAVPFEQLFAPLIRNMDTPTLLVTLRKALARTNTSNPSPPSLEEVIARFESQFIALKTANSHLSEELVKLSTVIMTVFPEADALFRTASLFSPTLEFCLLATGCDMQKFDALLRHIWKTEAKAVAAFGIWLLEHIASIVSEVRSALLPEHVARMLAKLDDGRIDFDDLNLGEQITLRFFLGRKHFGRPTPWDSGIPLKALLFGCRITDLELIDSHRNNALRVTIVTSDGRCIDSGQVPLNGLDEVDHILEVLGDEAYPLLGLPKPSTIVRDEGGPWSKPRTPTEWRKILKKHDLADSPSSWRSFKRRLGGRNSASAGTKQVVFPLAVLKAEGIRVLEMDAPA